MVGFKDNAFYEIIKEHTLSKADRKAGIEFDRTVWIGSKQKRDTFSKPIRIIQLHSYHERAILGINGNPVFSSKKTFKTRSSEQTLLIATDRMDLPVD